MLLKKRFISLAVGLALLAAVVGASANVANTFVSDAPVGQAIACNTTSGSGGGC